MINQQQERTTATEFTRDFYGQLQTHPQHIPLSVTMTPKRVPGWNRNLNIETNKDVRERYLREKYGRFEHRLSSMCCSHYRRTSHSHLTCFSIHTIEYRDKRGTRFVIPHTHGLMGIHADWWESLKPYLNDSHQVKSDLIKKFELKDSINQIQLKPYNRCESPFEWEKYMTKQIKISQYSLEGSGSFTTGIYK